MCLTLCHGNTTIMAYPPATARGPRLTTTRSSRDSASNRFRAEAVPLVHSRSVPSDRSNSTTKNAHFIVQKEHIVQSSFAMLCTLGCLDVTANGDDEAALDHWAAATPANESPPTSCARALHMRI